MIKLLVKVFNPQNLRNHALCRSIAGNHARNQYGPQTKPCVLQTIDGGSDNAVIDRSKPRISHPGTLLILIIFFIRRVLQGWMYQGFM